MAFDWNSMRGPGDKVDRFKKEEIRAMEWKQELPSNVLEDTRRVIVLLISTTTIFPMQLHRSYLVQPFELKALLSRDTQENFIREAVINSIEFYQGSVDEILVRLSAKLSLNYQFDSKSTPAPRIVVVAELVRTNNSIDLMLALAKGKRIDHEFYNYRNKLELYLNRRTEEALRTFLTARVGEPLEPKGLVQLEALPWPILKQVKLRLTLTEKLEMMHMDSPEFERKRSNKCGLFLMWVCNGSWIAKRKKKENKGLLGKDKLDLDGTCCSICTEGWDDSYHLMLSNCSHLFHEPCIYQWL